jgi:hypothetical protein
MSGETNLQVLLADMKPRLRPETFVFCTLPQAAYGDLAHLEPMASFAEDEGLTLVISQERADGEGLEYEGTFRCVSLEVHSSLEAVGLTAAVATALGNHGISANMLAGFFHDHVFVPSDRAELAMTVLGP